MKKLIVIAILALIAFAYYFISAKDSKNSRWYTQAQVIKGKKLFAANCASCHGLNSQLEKNMVARCQLSEAL